MSAEATNCRHPMPHMTFASTLAISAYTRICNAIKLLLESPSCSLAARDRPADTLGDRDHENNRMPAISRLPKLPVTHDTIPDPSPSGRRTASITMR